MTFQDTKTIKFLQCEILHRNQTVYFSDFPDFPIFEKNIFPNELWEKINVDFDQICDSFIQDKPFLSSQYQLLKEEFEGLRSSDERAKFLKERKESNLSVIARFEELTDPEFVTPHGKADEINKEAHALHLIIKYELGQDALISQYKESRIYQVVEAILEQGYSVDPHTGEIVNVITGETIRESQF